MRARLASGGYTGWTTDIRFACWTPPFTRMGCGRGADGGEESKVDRKSTRLNSSHSQISYAVFCLKKKKQTARHGRSPADGHPIQYVLAAVDAFDNTAR